MSKVFLKKNEERRLNVGHQWIFSNEIEKTEGIEKNGEVVELYSSSNKFLGKGFYNKSSLIAYRHLTDREEEIDKAFLFKRISMANSLRRKFKSCGNVYRMVNSESDFLPGLIIDKFDDRYSYQIFSIGMNEYAEIIKEILTENFKAVLIVEKNDNELRVMEGLEKLEGIVYESTETPVSEDKTFVTEIDDIKYKIDLLNGQKTGFYLDQAGSRVLIRKYINEKYRVLDLFCNEGGFALNAASAGAADITGVDSSEHSINTAKANSVINNYENIKFICKDVFEYMNELFQTTEKYDFIILDPPSFTKSKKNLFIILPRLVPMEVKLLMLKIHWADIA